MKNRTFQHLTEVIWRRLPKLRFCKISKTAIFVPWCFWQIFCTRFCFPNRYSNKIFDGFSLKGVIETQRKKNCFKKTLSWKLSWVRLHDQYIRRKKNLISKISFLKTGKKRKLRKRNKVNLKNKTKQFSALKSDLLVDFVRIHHALAHWQ